MFKRIDKNLNTLRQFHHVVCVCVCGGVRVLMGGFCVCYDFVQLILFAESPKPSATFTYANVEERSVTLTWRKTAHLNQTVLLYQVSDKESS